VRPRLSIAAALRLSLALALLFAAGCGGDDSANSASSGGGAGVSCADPLVLVDSWMGTTNFTEAFRWGTGTFTPHCIGSGSHPAAFIRWTPDKTAASGFKVLVDGPEPVILEVFTGDACSGTPDVCTNMKAPVGTPHVAGTYLPIVEGRPISVVVIAEGSAPPSGSWTVFMGD
jgi:hypothetical protein